MRVSQAFAAWMSLALTVQAVQAPPPGEVPLFKADSNLVIVTVFARDKSGQPLSSLKKDDFIVLENGKPQAISLFEFQDLETPPAGSAAGRLSLEEAARAAAPLVPAAPTPTRELYRDRRLLVLFFDWSSMPEADQFRAKEAAAKFIREQMTPNDLVAIATLGSQLNIVREFTPDRDDLLETVDRFQVGQMSELAAEGNTDTSGGETDAFAADETEFNLFNTDRKLGALEDLARKLSALPEKKAVVYFTSGISRTGNENESQLRSTINSAVRGNVSFYPVDVKGLTAEPPGGAASSGAGGRGTGLYSGGTQRGQRDRSFQQQDTLFALASDTGGKALVDNNDLSLGIQQAQRDLRSYYILGYYSSDARRDGHFRRVEVKIAPNSAARQIAKLDYRSGYFAPKEFKAFNSYDKEKQLEDALLLGDPVTELPLALEVNWFRLGRAKYFVPVAVKIPGSEVPLKKKGSAETTQFDFIAQVRDASGAQLSMVRDAISIQLRDEQAGRLAARSLVYDTGFTLSHGRYTLKMLVRENLTGKMGTFETSFEIPDLSAVKDRVRLSSVVWGSQRIPVSDAVGLANKKLARKQDDHPLVSGKQKLLPSVTHVFQPGQTLYAFAQLYEPSRTADGAQAVSAAVTLYRDGKKVLQSRPAQAGTPPENARGDVTSLMVELPLAGLPAGSYVAQFNAIDQVGRKFGFSRAPLVILAR